MDSGKLFSVGAVVVLVAGVAGFMQYRSWAKDEINRVERQAEVLRAQRDSIGAVTALRDSLRIVLEHVADTLDKRTDSLRQRVAAIESGRRAAERAVWHLRTSDDTERAFQEAYPEFAPGMRMTEYQAAPEAPALRYFMLPANTARTFIVYRLRADSLELARDALLQLDTLNTTIIGLKDSVIVLTKANEKAYRTGYDSAYAAHERLTRDYVALLKKPRFNLNVPSLTAIAGALGAGIAIGFVVK